MSVITTKRTDGTRIIWSALLGVFVCERCGLILHYDFGFTACPYCGRQAVHKDERGLSGERSLPVVKARRQSP